MAGALVKVCKPGTQTTIAVPPPNRQGKVKYGRVFFSLASDTRGGDPVHVRYEFGAAATWRHIRLTCPPVGRTSTR